MKNPDVRIEEIQTLSDNWYHLKKVIFEIKQSDGLWHKQARECYDRGNGAAILLYHPIRKTVILTKQFRMPTYINGNDDGFLIEVCAGVLDGDDPATCIRRETQEETGYTITAHTYLFDLYMSPGSVTETLSFFIAEYSDAKKTSKGGGLAEEAEDIEILELPFSQAMEMLKNGQIKDAKTTILLQHLKLSGFQ